MREKGVPEKYVKIVNMYREATTQVKSLVGTTQKFEMKVGLQQGSALSPYIFDMVVAGVKDQVPWSVLFVDDIVVVTTSEEEADRKLELWRSALEDRGLKISRAKTEYMWMNGGDQGGSINIEQEEVKRATSFMYYLGPLLMIVEGWRRK
ncbi:uncharacterized protein LOC135223106 [Macrobrachium nipponense]|uniref:uncharacterized protein LOC135223106 n=1 Tax=Macrobrachium nipponense TaxID=159736 RepID=UPI0030C896F3